MNAGNNHSPGCASFGADMICDCAAGDLGLRLSPEAIKAAHAAFGSPLPRDPARDLATVRALLSAALGPEAGDLDVVALAGRVAVILPVVAREAMEAADAAIRAKS